jgi:hypothetical protein
MYDVRLVAGEGRWYAAVRLSSFHSVIISGYLHLTMCICGGDLQVGSDSAQGAGGPVMRDTITRVARLLAQVSSSIRAALALLCCTRLGSWGEIALHSSRCNWPRGASISTWRCCSGSGAPLKVVVQCLLRLQRLICQTLTLAVNSTAPQICPRVWQTCLANMLPNVLHVQTAHSLLH